jgi:hypothetical protein
MAEMADVAEMARTSAAKVEKSTAAIHSQAGNTPEVCAGRERLKAEFKADAMCYHVTHLPSFDAFKLRDDNQ